MKKWYTYKRENVKIDHASGDVDIQLDSDIYINIPKADWLEIAEELNPTGQRTGAIE